jgi:ribosomal protein S27AE
MSLQSSEIGQRSRAVLTARVVPACPRCGAPGVYHAHHSIAESWPACHVEPSDPRLGQLVGPSCPNCGVPRPEMGKERHLGEIQW